MAGTKIRANIAMSNIDQHVGDESPMTTREDLLKLYEEKRDEELRGYPL